MPLISDAATLFWASNTFLEFIICLTSLQITEMDYITAELRGAAKDDAAKPVDFRKVLEIVSDSQTSPERLSMVLRKILKRCKEGFPVRDAATAIDVASGINSFLASKPAPDVTDQLSAVVRLFGKPLRKEKTSEELVVGDVNAVVLQGLARMLPVAVSPGIQV
jgi:hypothetical protein